MFISSMHLHIERLDVEKNILVSLKKTTKKNISFQQLRGQSEAHPPVHRALAENNLYRDYYANYRSTKHGRVMLFA